MRKVSKGPLISFENNPRVRAIPSVPVHEQDNREERTLAEAYFTIDVLLARSGESKSLSGSGGNQGALALETYRRAADCIAGVLAGKFVLRASFSYTCGKANVVQLFLLSHSPSQC